MSRLPEHSAILRWGLAGTGDLARRCIAPALGGTGGRLHRIWGRTAATAERLACETGAVASANFEEMLRDVEAVYIATPVAAHVPLALAAARAGVHMVIEKPLAAGTASGAALSELSQYKDIVVGVAYYRRLWPTLQRMRDIVRGTSLGLLQRFELDFSMPFAPDAGDPKRWRLDRAIAGTGVLADAGSHRIDLLLWLCGMPDHVRAKLSDIGPGGCETVAELRLAWAEGISARCTFAWGARRTDTLRATFAGGTVSLDPLDGGNMVIASSDGSAHNPVFDMETAPYLKVVEDVEIAARDGTPPLCPLDDAMAVDAVIAAALVSSRRGGASVTLTPTGILPGQPRPRASISA